MIYKYLSFGGMSFCFDDSFFQCAEAFFNLMQFHLLILAFASKVIGA